MSTAPSEHDQLIATLNQNRTALNDLLRHYAQISNAGDVRITSLTISAVTLEYQLPSTHAQTIDIPLPPSKSSLPVRLSALTDRAVQSRVPPLQFPHKPQTYLLLTLLLLEAFICLPEPHQVPAPLGASLSQLHHKLMPLFQSHHSLRLFFLFTVIVHALEGLYAITLIRRAVGRTSLGGTHAIAWAVQTAIVGFPSLFLLMDLLAENNPPPVKARS